MSDMRLLWLEQVLHNSYLHGLKHNLTATHAHCSPVIGQQNSKVESAFLIVRYNSDNTAFQLKPCNRPQNKGFGCEIAQSSKSILTKLEARFNMTMPCVLGRSIDNLAFGDFKTPVTLFWRWY